MSLYTICNVLSFSIRYLVITAIDVLRGRKLRPDSQNIIKWIQRRFPQHTPSEVEDELERLETSGELKTVVYKG